MSNELIVVVPDNGIRYGNIRPEFEPYLYYNDGEIPENEIDDDGNGLVDDVTGPLTGPAANGYYVESPDPGELAEWHGHAITEHIISKFVDAGARLDQEINASVMPIYAYADFDEWADTLVEAVELGARVVGLSLRLDWEARNAISELLKDYDVLIVGFDRDNEESLNPDVGPNNADYDNFLEVGLISTEKRLGSGNVDLLAEGHVPNTQSESSAIALITGEIAAIWAINPELTAPEMVELLGEAAAMTNPIIAEQNLTSEMGGEINFDVALALAQATLQGVREFGGAGDNTLDGTANSDTLHGEDGDDLIDGNGGPDKIYGGAGADSLFGGAHTDAIFGDAGADVIDGGTGHDRLFGGADDDLITGDAGIDTLHGGDGADSLSGGDGDDKIYGDGGDDTMEGGEGDNVLTAGTGNDSLSAGGGNDRLVGQGGDDYLFGGAGRDLLNGGADNDTLDGGSGRDRLLGGDGDDYVDGGRNIDNLYGGAGDDTVIGAGGDDRLSADAGNDVIEGGYGADTFFFAFNGGDADVLLDLDLSEDILVLRAMNDAAQVRVTSYDDLLALGLREDVTLEAVDGDTVMTLTSGDEVHTITLVGVGEPLELG